jgi:hypothetical protein
MNSSKLTRNLAAAVAAATLVAAIAVASIVTAVPAAAQNPLPTGMASATTPAPSVSASPTAAVTSTVTPACNGTLINGFLIIANNGTPNTACPAQREMTAPGPYTIYGLNLPADQYRLVSAGNPAHLPDVTTITYAPISGVEKGEGYISVNVSKVYQEPTILTTPPGSSPNTYVAATYLPQPGVGTDTGVTTAAQWIGPGGLYTLSIDSAHSSLTLKQAAALLIPVDLSELQASLTPTPVAQDSATPQPPPTGSGTTSIAAAETPTVLEASGLLLLSATLGVLTFVILRRHA